MPLTDAQADRVFDSMLVKLENKLARKIRGNFRKLSKLIREVIANGGEFAGNVVILNNQRELERILVEAYQDAIRAGSRFTRRDLDLDEPDEDDFNELLLLLLGWITITAAQHAQFITSTSIDIFNNVLQEEIAAGKTGPKLDRDVARKVAELNKNRVKVISTTESNTAFQTGSEETAKRVDGILLKRWQSQEDRRVRPTHVSANRRYRANPIPLDQLFSVGRGFGMRPLDPRLPSEEIIACRCYLRIIRPELPQ